MKAYTLILALLATAFGAHSQVATDFTRLTKTYSRPDDNAALTLTVDFPDARTAHSGEVNAWLVKLADNSFLPGDSYGGALWDHAALGDFVAGKFFRFAQREARKDSINPNPYHYEYSMIVSTLAPGFVTYRITSELILGNKRTMIGRQYTTYLFNGGEATNDVLFAKNKFKDVKKAVLEAAFANSQFMQSSYVSGQGITKSSQLRRLFSSDGNDGWDDMLLPPAALTAQGVVFSFSPAVTGGEGNNWWHFMVPYSSLSKYFSTTARQAIEMSYPSVFATKK